MAKKQLAKAELDRIKRSAKETPGFKKSKPKVKMASSKTGIKKAKKAVNFDKFKKPITKSERLPTKLKKKDLGFKAGAASGVAATYAAQKGLGTKKAKAKEKSTKQLAQDAYKRQKEKQKKYYDKKTESKRK